jgi:hypothetical protein
MVKKITESIDRELASLHNQIESGGPDMHTVCGKLEQVMRDLKVYDQKRHKTDQLYDDVNKRFEALVLSMEKLIKILKNNDMV